MDTQILILCVYIYLYIYIYMWYINKKIEKHYIIIILCCMITGDFDFLPQSFLSFSNFYNACIFLLIVRI